MKPLNNYISEGFFNNIGAGENAKNELFNEIIEWIRYHDVTSNNPLKYKNILMLGGDGRIHYSSVKMMITLYLTDQDTVPDNLYFGDDIILKIEFAGVSFNKLSDWAKVLPKRVLQMEIYNMQVKNWKWISSVDNIDTFIVGNSTLPSNGFTGFNPSIKEELMIQECDIENLSGFPKIHKHASVYITDCIHLEDISGIAERNAEFKSFEIRNCKRVKKIGDLSKIVLNACLSVDMSVVNCAMNGKGKLFKKVASCIRIGYDGESVSKTKEKEAENFIRSLYSYPKIYVFVRPYA